jgi:flagellar hook-length control protein FliK
MNREMFVGNLNLASQKEFSVKNNSSSEKRESKFADLMEKSRMQVQKDKAFKQNNSKQVKQKAKSTESKKELETLQEKLAEELELDGSQTAELALFMLENELDLEEMLDFLNGSGISEKMMDLSPESRAELAEMLNLDLYYENSSGSEEAEVDFFKNSDDSAELLKNKPENNDSELNDLLKNSAELELSDFKELFNSEGMETDELKLETIQSRLEELLAGISDQSSTEVEEALADENKEQTLILKLLQKLQSTEQQAETGPAEIVREFSNGDLLSGLKENYAEIIKKYLNSAETESESVNNRQKAEKLAVLAAELTAGDQSSSQKNSGDLSNAIKAFLQADKQQAEAETFKTKDQLEYFNPDAENEVLFNSDLNRLSFNSVQDFGIENSQADLNIEDQIMETFKAEYSAESKELTVELEPASLGKIDITLSYEGDKLIGKMLVESELVRANLEKSINTLKGDLLKEGINIEQFKIQTSENRPTQVEQQDQFAFNQNQSRFSDAEHGQSQNYQERNAFRQRYFRQKNSAEVLEGLNNSVSGSEQAYGWNHNALNLLA